MKCIAYRVLKCIGVFWIVKFFYRKKILILAYHGFEMYNECELGDGALFIKRETLDQRMSYLKENGFHIVSLESAVDALKNNTKLPDNSIVITVDDGWYSTIFAHDIFLKYDFPYTIYVSTYYADKEIPILNVVLRYVFWDCKKNVVHFSALQIDELSGDYSLSNNAEKERLFAKTIKYFGALNSTGEKRDFVEKISNLLGVDYEKIAKERFLSFLTMDEIKKISAEGADIQLHTHRHTMVGGRAAIEKEISDNISALKPYVQNKLQHFCYPSGVYDSTSEAILKGMEISSATTCERGFSCNGMNLYYLPRFLDGENISQIVFEAEVCGVSAIMRSIKNLLRKKKEEIKK